MSKKYAETIKNKNSAILALTLVCLICFLGLAVLTVMLVVQSGKYEGTLEASYQKNVYELVDNIESVEVNMSKIIATNSTSKQKDLLNEIYIACISASANLNALPISSEDISKANNHINKVGGYVVSLIDKVDDGFSLSEAEFENISALHEESKQTLYDLNNFMTTLSKGYSILDNVDFKNEENSTFDAGFINLDNPSSKVPTLIYDGPFSDSVLNKEVRGLGETEISLEEAMEKVEMLKLYYEDYSVEYLGEGNGKISTYNFKLIREDKSMFVQLSKLGGKLVSIVGFGDDTKENLSIKEAKILAKDVVSKFGFENMVEVWSQETGGVVYINFAPIENGVIYYPDLVKIKIDLSSGIITGLEATNYCYNHIEREDFQSNISILEAQKLLNSQLEVKERNYCVIPNEYVGESYAYEFVCEWKNYTYYCYIDSKTGEELNILRVVDTTNGDLLF